MDRDGGRERGSEYIPTTPTQLPTHHPAHHPTPRITYHRDACFGNFDAFDLEDASWGMPENLSEIIVGLNDDVLGMIEDLEGAPIEMSEEQCQALHARFNNGTRSPTFTPPLVR